MLTMIFLRSALGTCIYMHKDIIVYLNLYELILYKFKKNLRVHNILDGTLYDISQRFHTVSSRHLKSIQKRNHRGPKYASDLIFLKMRKADLKFLKTSKFIFHT